MPTYHVKAARQLDLRKCTGSEIVQAVIDLLHTYRASGTTHLRIELRKEK